MYQPAALKKGDKIGIVAPAGCISASRVNSSVKILEEWGFEIVFGQHLFSRYNQFAGTDKQRSHDLQQMIDDPQIKAVICARGGYGSIRTLQYLNFDSFMKNPKWIVGYSDITVFHSYLNKVLGVESLHAIMPVNFPQEGAPTKALLSLKDSLMGSMTNYEWASHPSNRQGSSSGMLIGGNLSIIYSLRGTSLDINTEGNILFIEDVGEELYHLDRMMINMKMGGKLKNLKGLIVGGMTQMSVGEPHFGSKACDIIMDAVGEYDYPVAFDFPGGHMPDNRALHMGHTLLLEVGDKGVRLLWS